MAPLAILISGGGIAGHALAFWLSRQPAAVVSRITVVEKFPTLRTTGLQIDLRGAGIEALRRMGLEPAFRKVGVLEMGIEWLDRNGKRKGYFAANKSGKGAQGFSSDFEIMRGQLTRILKEGTKGRVEEGKAEAAGGGSNNKTDSGPRVKYLYGTSIASYVETPADVSVTFEDETTATFDLVVGADGLGSRVRQLMQRNGVSYPSGAPDPSFHPLHNKYVAFFTIPRPAKEGEAYIASGYISTNHRFILTRRHSPTHIQVCLMWQGRSKNSSSESDPIAEELARIKRGDVAAEKAAFAKIFRGAGWDADELVQAMLEETDDFYYERQGVVKTERWSSETGRVVLLGDAAHAFSANGYGTSAAMVGAYVLAGELARAFQRKPPSSSSPSSPAEANGNSKGKGNGNGTTPSPEADLPKLKTALANHERLLRPATDKMQRDVEKDRDFLPSSELGIALLGSFVSFVSWLRLHAVVMAIMPAEKALPLADYSDVLQA